MGCQHVCEHGGMRFRLTRIMNERRRITWLSSIVTTVINLRGSPTQLEWRRRIEAGKLVGPTIYTAGEFVNEPRIKTPDDAEREVVTQAADGYDVIKFHEVWTPRQGYVTTVGVSREAYVRMKEVARARGIPLVGHAPSTLDWTPCWKRGSRSHTSARSRTSTSCRWPATKRCSLPPRARH